MKKHQRITPVAVINIRETYAAMSNEQLQQTHEQYCQLITEHADTIIDGTNAVYDESDLDRWEHRLRLIEREFGGRDVEIDWHD